MFHSSTSRRLSELPEKARVVVRALAALISDADNAHFLSAFPQGAAQRFNMRTSRNLSGLFSFRRRVRHRGF